MIILKKENEIKKLNMSKSSSFNDLKQAISEGFKIVEFKRN